MEVIKKGREQKGWSKKLKCTGAGNKGGGCGAILLVSIGDLYCTFTQCRDETDTFTTFRCSCCGVQTDIKDVDRPSVEIAASELDLDPNRPGKYEDTSH